MLDPFCGSGTTLIECAHLGAIGHGVDLNPLAIFLANAKLQALATSIEQLREVFAQLSSWIERTRTWNTSWCDDQRCRYLQSWFDAETLQIIEVTRSMIADIAGPLAPIFLTVASNLLRDYSLQDPNDLRIRRRKSPLPATPFPLAFVAACTHALQRIEAAQGVLGRSLPLGRAVLGDTSTHASECPGELFDAALTSPPYAMALPYIDTQRLSLVWLNLLPPERILQLESQLIGSREIRGGRQDVAERMRRNSAELPKAEADLCLKLERALGSADGFRRKAVPALLYRYFDAMLKSFGVIRKLLRPSAPFALIVGHNHTVLGGARYDIDTPAHLSSLAQHAGWRVEELVPLQTYQRYGYHMSNAVESETLLLLRND